MQPQKVQPSIDEYENSISKIQEKIKLLKASSSKDDQHEIKKNERSATLDTEYQKIIQLRSDQSVSLKSQWEAYRNEQIQYRKQDVGKRQVEFDEELKVYDTERRRKWKVEEEETMSVDRKKEVYNALLTSLRNFDLTEESPIITLPVELLESFWILNIEVPITKAELSDTIQLIENQC